MDKWDEMVAALIESAAEKDEKKAIRVATGFFVEIARTVEQIGADIDRIASALERAAPYEDGK
jgi:hypothetical protein